MLYIENTRGGDVSVFDPATKKLVRAIELPGHVQPDDLVGTKDGRTLYVNATKHVDHVHSYASEDYSKFFAVDTATDEVKWTIDIKGQVGHLLISQDERYVYNALFDRWYVARVDTEKRSVDYFPVNFLGGHGVRLSPDGQRLYVGSCLMGELNVFDLGSMEIIKKLYFRDPVRPFALTADEKTLFVQTSWMHGFHVVDIAQDRILRTIALPELPPETFVMNYWPNTVDHGLEITPDGSKLFALATTGCYVAVYSLPQLDLIKTIPVGNEPSWITGDGVGDYYYVSSRRSGDVSIISVKDLAEIARVPVGHWPQRMWFKPGTTTRS
jgi:YVTN family beta-propeller protein